MKNKNLTFSILALLVVLFTSCNEHGDKVITPKKELKTIKQIDFIHKIKVVIYQGHLHGKSFHANPVNESPLRIKQYFILEKNQQGKWKYIENKNDKDYVNEGKPVVMLGQDVMNKKYSFRYSYEFIYYDKNGHRLDDEFFDNSDVYQTLFSVKEYKEIETGQIKKVNNTKDFIEYTYRDTNPAGKMFHTEGTELISNYLGLKGYGLTNKNKISYKLNVKFVKFEDKSKAKSIYLEDADISKIEEQISFEIPIIIPVGRSAENQNEVFAKYFNIDLEKYEDLLWKSGDNESSQYWM